MKKLFFLAFFLLIFSFNLPTKILAEEPVKVPEGSWTLFQIGFFPWVPGVINYSHVYGVKLGLPMESGYGSVCGLEFALISGWTEHSYGLKLSPFANYSKDAAGVQLSTVNIASEVSAGLQLGSVNVAHKSFGFQVGVVNVSNDCGIQIGLVNVISDSWIPFFPGINFSF